MKNRPNKTADMAAYARARRAEAMAAGKCYRCQKAPALPGGGQCAPCRDKSRISARAYARVARQRPEYQERQKAWSLRLKLEVMAAYGGKCACCGVSDHQFLTIDHINGGGAAHRRSLGVQASQQFRSWLRREGYPPGFQVLCYNCHVGKDMYGGCPHQAG